MRTQRKPVDPQLRERVLIRDNYACRKCGRKKALETHHIIPIPEEQIDTEENLVALCKWCHREWEHTVYIRASDVSFERWLTIPPALSLIHFFACEHLWRDDISAKDMRAMLLQAQKMLNEFGPSAEESEVIVVDRQSPHYRQKGILIDKGTLGGGVILFEDGKTESIHGYEVISERQENSLTFWQNSFAWWGEFRDDFITANPKLGKSLRHRKYVPLEGRP